MFTFIKLRSCLFPSEDIAHEGGLSCRLGTPDQLGSLNHHSKPSSLHPCFLSFRSQQIILGLDHDTILLAERTTPIDSALAQQALRSLPISYNNKNNKSIIKITL